MKFIFLKLKKSFIKYGNERFLLTLESVVFTNAIWICYKYRLNLLDELDQHIHQFFEKVKLQDLVRGDIN